VRGASYQSIQIHKPDACGLAPFDVTSLLLTDIHCEQVHIFPAVRSRSRHVCKHTLHSQAAMPLAPSRRSCPSTYNSIHVTLDQLDHGVFELLGVVPITSASMPWANSTQLEREQSPQKLDASVTSRETSRIHSAPVPSEKYS
jgi:hypothetical protein